VIELTSTEQKVLRLLKTGLTNQQIADEMQLSPHTVKTHVRNMFRKTGVTNRVVLATRAQEFLDENEGDTR
jgi:DNA-binding NarL/FixJ family response regulator